MTPAITVVITCFNYGRYLPDAVASVLAQTRTDFELLIVDDGSTDDSLAVARRLAQADDRIRVITQANSGQPAIPRNRGVTEARGRYILCLDADDHLGPTVLEACAAALDADPAVGMAWAQRQDFGASDELLPILPWSLPRLAACNFMPCTTMYRREAWAAAGGYRLNVRGYEDWDLWVGIAEAGYLGEPVHGAVWYYRTHGEGLYNSVTGGDQRLKAQVVLNRPGLYSDGQLAWARGVLAGDPQALEHGRDLSRVPAMPEPRARVTIAADRSQRADWYVDADDLQGPWPARDLHRSLELVDGLGYTAVRVGDAIVARRRATDPIIFPVPFFRAGDDDAHRAAALADAVEDLVVVQALRAPGSLEVTRTARHVDVPADQLADLVTVAQDLMRVPAPVPAHLAPPLGRVASVLRSERAAAGDAVGARRAAAVERLAQRAGLEEARTVAVLAFADELVVDHDLLATWGAAFTDADDVTLVIVAADPAPLMEAIAATGLDGDGSPDMLAVEVAPVGVDAVLSRAERGDLPRLDTGSPSALRAALSFDVVAVPMATPAEVGNAYAV